MTLQQAQADRGKAISVLENLEEIVNNFRFSFKELEDFKDEVVADPARKAELENYFNNCECTMNWAELVAKYLKFKAIHEAIT